MFYKHLLLLLIKVIDMVPVQEQIKFRTILCELASGEDCC